MKHQIKKESGKNVLHISDQLVAADRADFDAVLPDVVSGSPGEIEVDFRGLTFMDSAGLGMLLTLREQAEKTGAAITISNPEGAVREMLELACFDTLFRIKSDA